MRYVASSPRPLAVGRVHHLAEARGRNVSTVSKVRLHGGDETFALKPLSFDTAEEQTYVKREVQCLRDVNHPHVVRIVDAFSLGPDRAGILMEYVETNVEYWLSTLPDGPVPKQQMTNFGRQLFSG